MRFLDEDMRRENKRKSITLNVKAFINSFEPLEEDYLVQIDHCTGAFFIEAHINAKRIVELSTIDVPLDPNEQGEYKANRDIVEDHSAFSMMKSDAKKGRIFSNLVAEYNCSFDEEHPLKIIGGQHRFTAIKEAYESGGVNHYHNFKVYFQLDPDQRLDVQLISNTNIVVSSDLLDRMFETLKGPELREWCQSTGLLEQGQDFADKKQRSSQITVRLARSFILSYLQGRGDNRKKFDKLEAKPILAKTGNIDQDWEALRSEKGNNLWSDNGLLRAGREFAKLHIKQKQYFEERRRQNLEYANKAVNYSIMVAWAYIAGYLDGNDLRLDRHYSLGTKESVDPLNAKALQAGKHKTDPDNYRGLGTRTDKKERGRLVEVFYLQAEKGDGISRQIVDAGIKKYHAKLAVLEAEEAENRLE